MLSKSAAKAFFLGGTGLTLVAFVGLTVDTFRRIPEQTNADKISPAVIRGKQLWERKNCMGCHTILGEGAYYAPELTKVIERRGEVFVRGMLKDPELMYPGQRRMVKYDFSDEQSDDMVAFLSWVGKIDANGFPPVPPMQAKRSAAAKDGGSGRPLIFDQACAVCHTLGGHGGRVGPALDDVGSRYDKVYLGKWLRDPASVKPGTKMPKLKLSDAQIEELASYLHTLRAGN